MVLGSDCVGRVVSVGPDAKNESLIDRRVLVYPAKGWISKVSAPENPGAFAILGGTSFYASGTLAEYLLLESADLISDCPAHLDDLHAAALPLAGLTAYRAVVTQAQIGAGSTLLVTGAGGGVAIYAVQIAKALGAKVFVTSGSQEKLNFVTETLKADGGVLYTAKDWGKKLLLLLHQNGLSGVDAVVDGSGGKTLSQLVRSLNAGGKFVSYGMTTEPRLEVAMGAVLKHLSVSY